MPHGQPVTSSQGISYAQASELDGILQRYLEDPTASWGLGTFGAIAEFHRTAEEPAHIETGKILRAVTARGALCLVPSPEMRAFAYELPGAGLESWNQALALCLPAEHAAMHRRAVITECGLDEAALRPEDRHAVLFDLGFGTEQVDVCVRTAEPQALEALRASLGRSPLAPDTRLMPLMPRLSPHRVFLCRFARVEVYQRIPGPNDRPPEGPHTHVLPNLLRHQRTHAATIPIPDGWIPCLHLYPASPMHDALGQPRPFDRAAYADFQTLLETFGDPELRQLKALVAQSVQAGRSPEDCLLPETRAGRATVRVAIRQLAQLDGDSPVLASWRQAFDRSEPAE
ncbi:MAG: hypothetical protein FJZ47_02880 [Candidatus Tectomicrobia bacterium]|uniref:Uncharacterized protein n=1 Tax=Tectimicrobiota bacterium TaxID=2528274 RepID=A0A938B2E7_UNCTE|nr:hypothetical protein [Candidatus Tectomicrobia bacterium]